MISVSLIGAGNVALHLFKGLCQAKNITVNQWYNRSLKPIASFKNQVEIITNINDLKPADITIIAVTDDAISKVSSSIPFKNHIVVHTSGAVGVHDLDNKHSRGVFYPLQTFSKGIDVDFSKVPICYEAIEKDKRPLLKHLAKELGCTPHFITTDQRKVLHLSAVFANNFTNHLYRIAHEISDAKQIDFKLLKPLIEETARKVQHTSPYLAQTGPAKRNDKKTIKQHLKLLEKDSHKAIYRLLTESIKKTYKNP